PSVVVSRPGGARRRRRGSDAIGAGARRRGGAALPFESGAIRGGRSGTAWVEGGLVRRRVLVGRPAPHAEPAGVIRAAGTTPATGRDDRARSLQCLRAS